MKRPPSLYALIAAFLLLTGCESIQLTEPVGTAFSAPPPDKAQVRITPFAGIPREDEVGATLFHIAVLVGGGQVDYPIGASVYDITDDLRYLGNFSFGRDKFNLNNSYKNLTAKPWISFDTAPGRKTLMLVEAPAANSIAIVGYVPWRQIDFIEFDAQPGNTNFIALYRHGAMFKPYFNEITISEPDRQYCEKLPSTRHELRNEIEARDAQIESYMQNRGIDPYARHFRIFCGSLSSSRNIVVPSQAALQQFAEIKDELAAIRDKYYPIWKEEKDHPKPYDLMKSYPPQPREKRTES